MRKLIFLFSFLFCSLTYANTETITWTVDGQPYATTSCESGDDIVLPNPPTKNGFTFAGWKGYTPIEFLDSTGTQWINTFSLADRNTRVKTKIRFMSNVINEFVCFGADKVYELYAWNVLEFHYNTGYGTTATAESDILELDWNKNIANYTINGETQPTLIMSESAFTTSHPMFIFALNRGETSQPASRGKIRVYYFQIYDNGVLVRDFIPVLDDAGTPCMFDRVTNQFFYNAGTGSFYAGPIITE